MIYEIKPIVLDPLTGLNIATKMEMTSTEVNGTSYSPSVSLLNDNGMNLLTLQVEPLIDSEYKDWDGNNEYLLEKFKKQYIGVVVIGEFVEKTTKENIEE